MSEARIGLLTAGGTVSAQEGDDGALEPTLDPEKLLQGVIIPKAADIDIITLDELDSTDINNDHRTKWLEALDSVYHKYDSFILSQGTDSAAYSSAMLVMSMLDTLQKPLVVLTAQNTLLEPGSDARVQIENSLRLAVELRDRYVGVFPVANGLVWNGARLRKYRTGDHNYLDTPGEPELARMRPALEFRPGIERFQHNESLAARGLEVSTAFEPNISRMTITGDTNPDDLYALGDVPGKKGLLLKAMGDGNLPDVKRPSNYYENGRSVIDVVEDLTDRGIAVAVHSAMWGGVIDMDRYRLGRKAKAAGALSMESAEEAMAEMKFRAALGRFPLRNEEGERVEDFDAQRQRMSEFLSANLANELLDRRTVLAS